MKIVIFLAPIFLCSCIGSNSQSIRTNSSKGPSMASVSSFSWDGADDKSSSNIIVD